MIKEVNKTVFEVNAECLVNPVNCEGMMEEGLSKIFKEKYPQLFEKYGHDCLANKYHVGETYFYNIDGQKIINFPTKIYARDTSVLTWIEDGLKYFGKHYKEYNIKSVAFPIFGSELGGLNKGYVAALIKHYLSKTDLDIYICLVDPK